jgi:hypothetical protein
MVVNFGVKKGKLRGKKALLLSQSDEGRAYGTGNIRGLKPNTRYFFKVSAVGVNGQSSQTFSLVTPSIPRYSYKQ